MAGMAVLTMCIWLASARYRVALVGEPFNRAWSIQQGQLVAEWMSRGPDGSLSGFGNTGWKFADDYRRRGGLSVSVLPTLTHSAAATYHRLGLPLWPLAGMSAAGAWLVRRAARRYVHPALCHACGYDLHGLPSHTPCPECGAARPSLWRGVKCLLGRSLAMIFPPARRNMPSPASP